MDVHRCRFVPYPLAEINALAFSHPSNPEQPTPPQLRLAVGRSNGDIEIWNPLGGSWTQETILRGGHGRTVEGLAWTQDPEIQTSNGGTKPGKLRLFSIGYSPVVTEWNLATGLPARQSGGTYGDVWCMAAQPRQAGKSSKRRRKEKHLAEASKDQEQEQEQLLALGCGNGSVVLLSTADDDLVYYKTLPLALNRKTRAMSIDWSGRDNLVVGYSDGQIRLFDIRGKGSQITSMSLGRSGKGKRIDTLVWSVKVLGDGNIVSADSTGEIKIWNAKNHTLLQAIKGHLDADVLSLAANYNASLIFSGGMDRRTTTYQKFNNEQTKSRDRWNQVSHQRFHRSDVKAMAIFESRQLSVVVSGGADATPIIIPVSSFGKEHSRALPSAVASPIIGGARNARCIISWWGREVSVWQIPSGLHTEDLSDDDLDHQGQNKLVARLAVQGEESINSAAINSSGDLLVVSTNDSTKLFHLRPSKVSSNSRVSKVELPKSVGGGARIVQFSPDGKWIVQALSNNWIRLVRLMSNQDVKSPYRVSELSVSFDRTHGRTKSKAAWGTYGDYDHVISRLAWSSDSRILVAGDLTGNLDTWVLDGNEDSQWTEHTLTNGSTKLPAKKVEGMPGESSDSDSEDENDLVVILGQHWKRHAQKLPVLGANPLVLAFRPHSGAQVGAEEGNPGLHATRHTPLPVSHNLPRGEDRLLAVTAKHEIFEFHTMTGKISEWSRRNPTSMLPLNFRNVLDRAMGCFWDVQSGRQCVFVYGTMWIWMFDLGKDLPKPLTVDSDGEADGAIVQSENNTLKRKRDQAELEKREAIKRNAGAGGKIPAHERPSAIGAKLQVRIGDDSSSKLEYDASRSAHSRITNDISTREEEGSEKEDDDEDEDFEEGSMSDAENNSRRDFDDDDDDADGSLALVKFRRSKRQRVSDGPEADEDSPKHPGTWHTYKYRSILGIVPLDRPSTANGAEMRSSAEDTNGIGTESLAKLTASSGSDVPEVAIVERPLWEAELKPRWEGPQEWGAR